MKRLLSIIGAISLVGTSTTSLVACKDKTHEYKPEELKELKEKNKIDTKNKEIRDNLEWIAPQERPFNTVDNKYYYVVWRGDKNSDWRIVNFKHSDLQLKILDKYSKYELVLNIKILGCLFILLKTFQGSSNKDFWINNNWELFKVYRWNLTTQEPDLIIDDKGTVKVKGE